MVAADDGQALGLTHYMKFSWRNYDSNDYYDELIGSGGRARPAGGADPRPIA